MIVTIVCDVLGRENNGTTIAGMNLIKSLQSKGHEVRVVCADAEKKGTVGYFIVPQMNFHIFNKYIEKNGVRPGRVDKDVLYEAIKGSDVVHLLIPFFLSRAAIKICHELDIPITAGFHCQAENVTSHLFLMNSKLANRVVYKNYYKYVYKYCDCVHYPTEFIREVFEHETKKTNAYVISNGVNDCFKFERREKPKELKDKFVILCTGRYSREKAQTLLIDAVNKSKYKDKIQIIFAGDGPLKEQLGKEGEMLPNKPIMQFYSRKDLLDVLYCADLYVHTACIEIEAISCLEAISSGLVPVISNSPRSATRYFALDDNNLFKVNDSESLKEKIEFWMENEDLKKEYQKKYEGFAKQFNQTACMDKMEEMLKDAIANHKKRECVK